MNDEPGAARPRSDEPRTRAFVAHFLSAYPARTALMVLALGGSALADGLGLLTLLPVLELAIGRDGGAAALSPVSLALSDALARIAVAPTLPNLLALIVASFTLKGLLHYVAMRQVGFAVANVGHDLRLALLDALMRARWSHVEGESVGHVANAISSETHRASWGYQSICGAIAEVLQIGVYLAIIASVAWQAAAALPLVALLVVVAFGRLIAMSRTAGNRSTGHLRDLVRRLAELLGGLKAIKAMGLERESWSLMTREATEFRDAQRQTVIAREALKALHEPLLAVLMAALFGLALGFTDTSFATLLLLAALLQRLMTRASLLQGHYQSVTANESAFFAVQSQIDAAGRLVEPAGGVAAPRLERALRLDGVSFRHDGRAVLERVDETFAAGGLYAVTGASGAGKSTLIDLLLGLREPGAGRVVVDGVPLADVDPLAWRALIGYVPQEPLLFHDTIRRNITLASPAVDDAAIAEACRIAGVTTFLETLPDGLDHVVGERGGRLSGGQRQRLCLARALVRRPRLLLLDEATSALDPEAERLVCENLAALRGRTTTVAVSHRPAILAVADRVLHLEHGRLHERTRRAS